MDTASIVIYKTEIIENCLFVLDNIISYSKRELWDD